MKDRLLFVLFMFGFQQVMLAQIPQFSFEKNNTKSQSITFKEINNLVLLPVTVNESDTLYFILDTGAENIIVFGSEFDLSPVNMDNLREIKLGGLGQGEEIDAFVSQQNKISFGGIKGEHLNLIYVEDKLTTFSDLLGHPVHGILGIAIFHRFIIEINYYNSTLTFNEPKNFKPRRRFKRIDISLLRNRPYIELDIQLQPNVNLITNLLIDLGESKPLSLYLDSHEFIFLPEPNYEANLGKGLTGIVIGKVARVNSIKLNKYTINNVVTAFPNNEDIFLVSQIDDRHGSLGAGILKKFVFALDLNKKKLYIKRTGLLKQSFSFDKTGLIITSEGEKFDTFKISGVIKDSAGDKAGFKEGDKIIAIEGQVLSDEKIGDVLNMIESSGRRFRITVKRGAIEKTIKIFISRF